MMKVWVKEKELWPDFELHLHIESGLNPSHYEGEYEVSERIYKDYQEAREKFLSLRREIGDIVLGSDPL